MISCKSRHRREPLNGLEYYQGYEDSPNTRDVVTSFSVIIKLLLRCMAVCGTSKGKFYGDKIRQGIGCANFLMVLNDLGFKTKTES
eukprot:6214722-Pleurochrysis_carterae.AAC.2